MENYEDRISLEYRIATIETQYKQLFDLLKRHNDINEKLESRLDALNDKLRMQGWALASTLLGVILSMIITIVFK